MDWVILLCYSVVFILCNRKLVLLVAAVPLIASMIIPSQLFIGAALVFTFAALSVCYMLATVFAVQSREKWLPVALFSMAVYCIIFAIDSWVNSHAETWIWTHHEVIIVTLHAFILISLNRTVCKCMDSIADHIGCAVLRAEGWSASDCRSARRASKKGAKG